MEISSSTEGRKALIIGSGIGGLCAAIALQRAGWRVNLFDKTPSRSEAGAGIVLAANAVKVLRKLGVAEKVLAHGVPVGKAEIRTRDGKLLVDLPTKKQAELYGTPSYLIYRASLQSVLDEQLEMESRVQFNKRLVEWEQDGDKVTALFEDGTKQSGDVLIGADGLHSTVRELMMNGGDPLRYSGYTAYRGISVFQDNRYIEEIGGGFEAWGAGKRFGYSHLGQGRIYWFAAINSREGSPNSIPSGARKQSVLRHFQGWYRPIEAVIEATEDSSILNHDIYDRKPLRTWCEGRVTLLGDSAHPMLPNLGQGGAQAMEDSLVLAECLSMGSDNVASALLTYEHNRIPRTTRVVRQSRRMGRLVQIESALGVGMRNLLLRSLPGDFQANRLRWLLGYEH
ncbi:FAD-dependent monooxygenase [Cohnella lupini]|uniref:2-polyprenyl-6-methoxyphenol hydroxylase-like FAD-dependent oxidoreductase n=1 Tax=Cohnella lupini TaxID=1294267 RepID=A0A3D9HST6_9BACL|nr:FAD-dependent monooxygenase [Cohnella lupini]RED51926.1 2-polyprenyl-6-methoxyphenol hydroxylase-like FAD-dependent oxidoreductase [Cohnella lupini]